MAQDSTSPQTAWTPDSWRSLTAVQQPVWPDEIALKAVTDQLSQEPPLVFAGEARTLTEELAAVAAGQAFVLQAGDCAESFDGFGANSIRDKLKVVLQMAAVLTYSAGVPIVKVGRIAGQFAKPRSADMERRGDDELPSFRGHMVNDIAFDAESRVPEAQRLLRAYQQSASTLNLIRALTKGGYADLQQVHVWNQQFVASSPEGRRYETIANEIDRALRFMEACGVGPSNDPRMSEVDFYTSHEALVLPYEEALTRRDSLTDGWYDCSAHMLWIGERTRQLDQAHIEFFRGIRNPIGCKLGPSTDPAYVLELCERLNPDRVPGHLTLITRMGAERVRETLPALLTAVKDAGHPVVWICDPMHGNTFSSSVGYKTRHFEDILTEVAGFFAAHEQAGTWPGGVHLELTGEDVTECLGGGDDLVEENLDQRYETMCDPRLNARQSLDLAFRISELLRG
ncbi:MAG: 3-deoxy-7-phosphoheptulonate synthase class II [Acidimicrobiia bacterium]|nr:3-deoxy-7-phosphoheptulonate synthase class II [Acidimicrobiia bacterium]MBP8181829.1 3-deoxy-7-phosphoheptulonate synthase class II [Acidimicrobiia bacterium]